MYMYVFIDTMKIESGDRGMELHESFLLWLNVLVNNFSVMSGRSHRFQGNTNTFRGVNVSLLEDTTRRR